MKRRRIKMFIKLKDIVELHSDQIKIKEYFASFDPNKIDLLSYYVFAKVAAHQLITHQQFNEYLEFRDEYNSYIQKNFGEELKFIKNQLVSVLTILHASHADISLPDLTDIFKKDEFSKESDLKKILYNALNGWEDNEVVKQEQVVGFGRCDISVEGERGKVAIELKKGKAKRKDVYQAFEYSVGGSGFSPVLIAKEFSNDVLVLAKELKVACYHYKLVNEPGQCRPCDIYIDKVDSKGQSVFIEEYFAEMFQSGALEIEYVENTKIPVFTEKYLKEAEEKRALWQVALDTNRGRMNG
jgi:hypothetical protein